MAKQIIVSDDVYEILQRLRSSGQSVSEVVRRRVRSAARVENFYDVRAISADELNRTLSEESGVSYRVKL